MMRLSAIRNKCVIQQNLDWIINSSYYDVEEIKIIPMINTGNWKVSGAKFESQIKNIEAQCNKSISTFI